MQSENITRACFALSLLALILVVPVRSVAQQPSASEIFKRSLHAHQDYSTIQMDVEWSYSMDGTGTQVPSMGLYSDRITAWIESGRNRIRIESKPTKKMYVTDGAFHYRYDGKRKEYVKVPAPPNLDGLILREVLFYPSGMDITGAPRIAKEETIKIKGKTYECWLLELPITFTGSGARSPYLVPEPMRLWMDKETGLLLKSTIRSNVPTSTPGVTAVHSMKVTDLRLNPIIPDSQFQFEPSKGAREVSALSEPAAR